MRIATHQEKEDCALAELYGAGVRLNVTQSQYVYELNDWTIWEIRGGWQCAQVIDNRYKNHTPQKTLQEALGLARDN